MKAKLDSISKNKVANTPKPLQSILKSNPDGSLMQIGTPQNTPKQPAKPTIRSTPQQTINTPQNKPRNTNKQASNTPKSNQSTIQQQQKIQLETISPDDIFNYNIDNFYFTLLMFFVI